METRTAQIEARKAEIRSQLEADVEVTDLPALQAELKNLNDELTELRNKATQTKTDVNDITNFRNKKDDVKMDNKFNSVEYRTAFKNYLTKGTAIPAEMRAGTSDVVMPSTMINKIYTKLENIGKLYNLVTKTAYKTGVSYPVASLLPEATWVAEKANAADSNVKVGSVVFAGNRISCKVPVTLELDTMALDAFESFVTDSVVKAIVKGIDAAILNGSGSGAPKGILKETAAATVVLDKLTYAKLCDMEAAIPAAYDDGAVYVMNKATFYALRSMKDGNTAVMLDNGADGKPVYTIFGRTVVIVDQLPGLAAAKTGDVVAFAVDPSMYVLNSNLQLTVKNYMREETDEKVTKGTMIADGKLLDAAGLVFFTAPTKA